MTDNKDYLSKGQPSRDQSRERLEQAITDGTKQYFADCRSRVPGFVKAHFCFPGSWHTNRAAFGFDLLRAPVNLFWAPVYTVFSIVRYTLHRLGYMRFARCVSYIPAGFTTQVQKNLALKLYSELLRLDCDHSKLEACITSSLEKLYIEKHNKISNEAALRIESLVNAALKEYQVTRTASSDITNTITSTLVGAFAFYKFTPGGIGFGFLLAALLAKYFAAKDFIFGESLGSFYYFIFPPEPSLALTTYSLTGVLVIFSIFATFSGIVTDPIQAFFRIHHKRLNKMIDHLERDFLKAQGVKTSFRPKDQYIARLLDIFDVVKSNIHH